MEKDEMMDKFEVAEKLLDKVKKRNDLEDLIVKMITSNRGISSLNKRKRKDDGSLGFDYFSSRLFQRKKKRRKKNPVTLSHKTKDLFQSLENVSFSENKPTKKREKRKKRPPNTSSLRLNSRFFHSTPNRKKIDRFKRKSQTPEEFSKEFQEYMSSGSQEKYGKLKKFTKIAEGKYGEVWSSDEKNLVVKKQEWKKRNTTKMIRTLNEISFLQRIKNLSLTPTSSKYGNGGCEKHKILKNQKLQHLHHHTNRFMQRKKRGKKQKQKEKEICPPTHLVKFIDMIEPKEREKEDLNKVYFVFEQMDMDLRQLMNEKKTNTKKEIILEIENYFNSISNDTEISFENFYKELIRKLEKNKFQFSKFQIKRIIFQILKGLSTIHSFTMIHADIKPSNILVSKENSFTEDGYQNLDVKLCDFGLITKAHVPTGSNDVINSSWYRAPENFRYWNSFNMMNDLGKCIKENEQTYSENSDIWGLGCLFGELLVSKPIFRGANEFEIMSLMKQCKEKGVELYISQFKERIDHEAMDLLKKMLEFNPKDRISSLQCLKHSYFSDFHQQNSIWDLPSPKKFREKKDYHTLNHYSSNKAMVSQIVHAVDSSHP